MGKLKKYETYIFPIVKSFALSLIIFFILFDFKMTLVFFICSSILYLLAEILIKKKATKNDIRRTCVNFMDDFLMSYVLSKDIDTSFEEATKNSSEIVRKYLNPLSNLTSSDKLTRLSSLFRLNQYDFFIALLKESIEKGGNITSNFRLLMVELDHLKANIKEYDLLKRKKTFEFISLWMLVFLILIIVKYSLSNISQIDGNDLVFSVTIFALLAIFALLDIGFRFISIDTRHLFGGYHEV